MNWRKAVQAMHEYLIAGLVVGSSLAYGKWKLKDLDPFNKNGGLRKTVNGNASVDCLAGLMFSGAFGAKCTACATGAASAGVAMMGPAGAGVVVLTCKETCLATGAFVAYAADKCGWVQ